MATYRAQGDLFAYALFEKTRSANKIAGMRRFADGADEAYDGLELNTDLVDRVLKAFRDNASLAIRFQTAEAEYQRKILGLSSAAPWDVDAFPTPWSPRCMRSTTRARRSWPRRRSLAPNIRRSWRTCSTRRTADGHRPCAHRDDLNFTTGSTDRAGSSSCTATTARPIKLSRSPMKPRTPFIVG